MRRSRRRFPGPAVLVVRRTGIEVTRTERDVWRDDRTGPAPVVRPADPAAAAVLLQDPAPGTLCRSLGGVATARTGVSGTSTGTRFGHDDEASSPGNADGQGRVTCRLIPDNSTATVNPPSGMESLGVQETHDVLR